MSAFEYRPKVGLFLKKTISKLLHKWNNKTKKWKSKKVIKVLICCKENVRYFFILFY